MNVPSNDELSHSRPISSTNEPTMNQPANLEDQQNLDEAGTPAPVPRVPLWGITLMLLLLVAAITGIFFLGWLPKVRQHQVLAHETHQRATAPPTVEFMRPYPAKAMTETRLPGEIQALEETVIFPRTSGYLKKWHVDIGDQVEEGQLLAEIDAPEVEQQLQQAEATVEQLKARRRVADTKLDLAKYTLKRVEQLIKSRAASQQDYDERKAEFAVAEHQVKVADADIAAGMAELQRITELQSFAKVYAPFSGTIIERSIDLGQLVTSGNGQEQSLFRLARTDRVRVIVYVPQIYASNIEQGREAKLIVREMPQQSFTGKVTRTARALDLTTRTMRIEIEVPNEKGLLLPGAYVQVQLPVRRTNPPLMVPASALLFNAGGAQLAVVNSQDEIELREVEVEADHGTNLGIAKGITEEDRVVVNPGERLTDGLSVITVRPGENET